MEQGRSSNNCRKSLILLIELILQQLGDHGSGVVQTAWGLLALIAAGCDNKAAIAKAAAFLIAKQVHAADIIIIDRFYVFICEW